jgi:tetratricopeptide (TPR) repeat protein
LKQAEIYAQQAVAYAQESGDSALLISAILSQAWAYYYEQRCAEGVAVIARAIPLLKQGDVPRSLAARVWSTQAVLQARNGQTSNSLESLRKAHSVVNKLNDDYYAFTNSVIIEMTGNEGMAHYHAGNYDKALDTFTQLIDDASLVSRKPLSGKGRVEMLNFMAFSELKSPKRDMEKALNFWQTGLEGAKTLQSKQRFNESLAIYDMMEAVWPSERRIMERRELTHW